VILRQKDNKNQGSQFRNLKEVLPSLSRDQVKKILAEMKRETETQLSPQRLPAKISSLPLKFKNKIDAFMKPVP
jgi:hypothetical protein